MIIDYKIRQEIRLFFLVRKDATIAMVACTKNKGFKKKKERKKALFFIFTRRKCRRK